MSDSKDEYLKGIMQHAAPSQQAPENSWKELGYGEWGLVNGSGKITGRVKHLGSIYIAYKSIAGPLGEFISLAHAKKAVEEAP